MGKHHKVLIFGSSGQICKPLIRYLYKKLKCNFFIVSRDTLNFDALEIKKNQKKPKAIKVKSYELIDIKRLLNDVKPNIIIYSLAAGSVKSRNHNWQVIKLINFTIPTLIAEWIFFNKKRTLSLILVALLNLLDTEAIQKSQKKCPLLL